MITRIFMDKYSRVVGTFTGPAESVSEQPIPEGTTRYEDYNDSMFVTSDYIQVGGEFVFSPKQIEKDYAANRYEAYPSLNEQMDMIWHAMDAGTAPKIEPFYSSIKAVKEQFPKPVTDSTM